jgi:uncharacterized protein (DUF362 family)
MKKDEKTHFTDSISRRAFIKTGTVLGASSILAGSHITGLVTHLAFAADFPDLASVQGVDAYANTVRVVEMLGGMGRFVSKQSRVALLINSDQANPGTFVKPEIVLAVTRMSLDAGAGKIGVFKRTGSSYWRRSRLSEKFKDEIQGIQYMGGEHKTVAVKGRVLKEAQVSKTLLDWDVFINIPIAKDHTAVRFTGTMKNMMGLTSFSTNHFFHFGSGARGWYDDPEFLSQCIADVNLVRRPDLSVFDGMEMLTTNGPCGPGRLIRPQRVFAATDAVAADVYGANLLGLRGQEILATRMAHEHGMGQLDLSAVGISEVTL